MFEEIASIRHRRSLCSPGWRGRCGCSYGLDPSGCWFGRVLHCRKLSPEYPGGKTKSDKARSRKGYSFRCKRWEAKETDNGFFGREHGDFDFDHSRFGFSASGALRPSVVGSFEGRLASLSSLAATTKAPPRTTERQQLGLLASPAFKQSEVKELAEEKQLHGDTLAHAVLEQSRALTSLIGQISQSSSDPLADLGSGGGV